MLSTLILILTFTASLCDIYIYQNGICNEMGWNRNVGYYECGLSNVTVIIGQSYQKVNTWMVFVWSVILVLACFGISMGLCAESES